MTVRTSEVGVPVCRVMAEVEERRRGFRGRFGGCEGEREREGEEKIVSVSVSRNGMVERIESLC